MTLAQVMTRLVGADAPIRFSAYDGSAAGPADAEITVELKSPKAMRYLVTSPGEVGLARAYVSGELELTGDTYVALHHLAGAQIGTLSWRERAGMLRAVGLGALRPLAPPPEETRLGGLRRHTLRRDSRAISHHYDVSNTFYEWVLGPTMAYTCAVFPHADATLEQAQEEKVDLVCRKLGLRPGMRLLDVGCGWGTMVRHAARNYGVTVLGVTLSRQQAEWAQKAIAEDGLAEVAEVRFQDYREVTESGFDAVSSIGLTEHIGEQALPAYFAFLASRLRPGGRLLNHAIMRPTTTEKATVRRGFINRYVFPDGELLGVGRIASTMQDNGFEIRHEENLREHYARTLADWCANLDAHWEEALAEVGPGKARVWRLYMAGARLGFDLHKIELHQILGVKVDGGDAGMPLRPDWEKPAESMPPARAVFARAATGAAKTAAAKRAPAKRTRKAAAASRRRASPSA